MPCRDRGLSPLRLESLISMTIRGYWKYTMRTIGIILAALVSGVPETRAWIGQGIICRDMHFLRTGRRLALATCPMSRTCFIRGNFGLASSSTQSLREEELAAQFMTN